MSNLNKDILYLIFEELRDNSDPLFSCLMVNRLWCETAIPILWRDPWCYDNLNYNKKSKKISLFTIISQYLFDDIKEFITNQEIQLPSGSKQSLLFDYFSYCRSINVNIINEIISIGSDLDNNQFYMQQKFYSLLMKKCLELKYFDMISIKHQIFQIPEAMVRFQFLCELQCDTSIDPSYFYGLSECCQYLQRLDIYNVVVKPNPGIVKLIEVQKNLKYFEWGDEFDDVYFTGNDPYKEVLLALVKKAESLNFLRIFALSLENYEHILFQEVLSKFYNLKIIIIDGYLFLNEKKLEGLKMQAFHELEILNIEGNRLEVISSIIENSGASLKKILFNPRNIDYEYEEFNESSLYFIRKVHENCPSIEYLSIAFSPTNSNFIELENLLKVSQNLKSLLIVILDDNVTDFLNKGKELLRVLTSSISTNLKEIRFCGKFKFPLQDLDEFLGEWEGRQAISMFTTGNEIDDICKHLVNLYKKDGVIEKFENLVYADFIYYIKEICFG